LVKGSRASVTLSDGETVRFGSSSIKRSPGSSGYKTQSAQINIVKAASIHPNLSKRKLLFISALVGVFDFFV